MEKIIIKSNRDLEARLWFPNECSNGIVIAPSFRNTFEQPICLEAAETFYQNNYAVLAFNFIGHGNSSGTLREVNFRAISENVNSVIKFFRETGISKVGVYAISLGAIATVLSNEKPDAQFFISPSPLYNPKGLLERYSKFIDSQEKEIKERGYAIATSGSGRGNFEIGEEWINEMRNGKYNIKQIYVQNKIPTLIVQGTGDEPSRLSLVKDFVKSTNSEYFSLDGGDHDITNAEHRKIVVQKAIEFFNYNLR